MKRVVLIVVGLAAVLVGLIAWRIRAQQRGRERAAVGLGRGRGARASTSRCAAVGARDAGARARGRRRCSAGAVIVELDCDEPRARLAEAEARLEARGRRRWPRARRRTRRVGQSSAARGERSPRWRAQTASAARTAAGGRARGGARRGDGGARGARRARPGPRRRRPASARAGARGPRVASRPRAVRRAAAAAQARPRAQSRRRPRRSVRRWRRWSRARSSRSTSARMRAPRAGVLERVYYEPGELVTPGAVVARLVDPTSRASPSTCRTPTSTRRAWATRAEVHADAYPGRSFRGTIERIGLEAEFTPRNVQTRSDRDRLVYPGRGARARTPSGLLRPGMPARSRWREGRRERGKRNAADRGARARAQLRRGAGGARHRPRGAARASSYGLVGPTAPARPRPSACLAGLIAPDARHGARAGRGPRSARRSRAREQLGLMPQQYSLYGDLIGRREPALLRAPVRPAARASSASAASACSRSRGSRASPTGAPTRSPAACTRSSRSPARSCTARACCCSTSPPTASIRSAAASSGSCSTSFVADGMAVLVSTPYMDEAARCHRVGLMHAGQAPRRGRARARSPAARRTRCSRSAAGDREALHAARRGTPRVLAASPAGRAAARRGAPGQRRERSRAALAPLGADAARVPPDFEDLFLARVAAQPRGAATREREPGGAA